MASGFLIFFGFKENVNFAIVFGLALVGFYIFRGGLNLLYSYAMANFVQNLYAQTKKGCLMNTLVIRLSKLLK